MSELKISGCMSVVKDMSDMDRDALLARLDQYRADGVPVERAQIMATSDTLAEIEDERREFMRMLKEQHPEIFVVTAPKVRQSADRPIFTDDILKTAIAESKALSGVIGSDIENDAQGVIPGRPRMLDRRLANGTYTEDDVKAEFPKTLAAIRAAHGQELTLWRADAPDDRRIAEAKTVYMADQEVATKYANNGRQALPYRVKIDDLLGVYARPSGYYEAIVRIPEGGLKPADGEGLRQSADRITDTPEFKRWFGDSKVVDENGEPLAMYHGTFDDFSTFERTGDLGFHFGTAKAANDRLKQEGKKAKNKVRDPQVMPVYVRIENPADMPDLITWSAPSLAKELLERGYITEDQARPVLDSTLSQEGAKDPAAVFHQHLVRALETNGYDGIRYRNLVEGKVRGIGGRNLEEILEVVPNPAFGKGSDSAFLARFKDTKYPVGGATGATEQEVVDSARKVLARRSNGFDYSYIAFRPAQIKSAIGNSGAFATDNPDISKSADRTPLGFYSALARSIDGVPIKSAPAGAWKTAIKGLLNKGAIKQDELEWSGLEDWMDLQQGKISKEQVAEYLKQGGVRVEETVLGESGLDEAGGLYVGEYGSEWAIYRLDDGDSADPVGGTYASRADAERDLEAMESSLPTKYGQYTLPGGENYREVLLTLPSKEAAQLWEVRNGDKSLGVYDDKQVADALAARRGGEVVAAAGVKPAAERYRSNHWDQPNVLAHIRVNDRTDADGSKVLFVEEIQSDWGQEGKKSGFLGDLIPQNTAWQAVDTLDTVRTRAEAEAKLQELQSFLEQNREPGMESRLVIREGDGFFDIVEESRSPTATAPRRYGVPRAPFVTKTEGWLNLALKRVMIMAAEGGYDKVAFVNGEQSADRYDLSKQVNYIQWNPGYSSDPNVMRTLVEMETVDDKMIGFEVDTPPGGAGTIAEGDFAGKTLEDVLGKEIAQKINESDSGDLRGLDLKVGGKGMIAFYDTIVPTALKKLLPKVGGGQMATVSIGSNRLEVLDDPSGVGFIIYDRQENSYYRGGASGSPWSDDPYRAKVYLSESSANKAIPDIEGGSVGLEQPGFDVTPAMREKVAGGLPLFSRDRVTETPEFKAWSGGAPLVRLGEKHAYASGKPVVVEALHGTTNDGVTEFSRDKASIESDWGAGFYASNTPGDVANNYANVDGPDLTRRIERLAEQIESEEGFDGDSDEAMRVARQRLSDEAPNTMKLYMRFNNPAVLGGGGETYFDYSETYNEDTDEYGEPTGLLVDFVNAMDEAGAGLDVSMRDLESTKAKIFEAAEGEGLKLSDLTGIVKDGMADTYSEDGGSSGNSEFMRQALEGAGFDGVIDATVFAKFGPRVASRGTRVDGMPGLTKDTVHFIAFSPAQVKSATGNRGTFDPNDPDIRKSSDRATWTDARIDRLLDTHAYTMDDAKTKAYAGFVSPEDYLRATTPASGVERLESEKRPLDVKQLADQTQPIYLKGEPQDGGTWKTTGHEGRHRMMALRDAGVRRVPVVFDVGYGLKREPLEGVYVTPQRWSGEGSAQGGFFVDSLIPISYKHARDLRETFGGDGAVRFSPDRAQTETPEFKRWFGNSQIRDESGNPLVVYHATTGNFTEFKPGGDDPTMSGPAMWFTDSKEDQPAAHNTRSRASGFRDGANVMPVYLKMERPLVIDDKGMLDWAREVFAGGSREFPQLMPKRWVDEVRRDGEYDGIIFDGPALGWKDAVREYIVFEPTQIKSAIGNSGQFDPSNPDITKSADRPWFDDLSKLKVSTNYQLGDLFKTSKKLNWWNRTVGTQYNLAQKNPEFKRVFDAVQTFINDVSAYASRAADLAPTILPKLETLRDITKSPLSAEDVKALRDPIFGGTLKYTRDDEGNIIETEDVSKAGVVFTNEELRDLFGLNDRQVKLYREFRRATNKSLTDLAVSDMLRYLGKDGEGVRQRALEATNLDGALDAMVAHLDMMIEQQPERAKVLEDSKRAIKEKAGQAIGLMARGYAPLSRFGQYTVYAVGKDGEQLYFSMFENERDANKMAREMREQYPDATVTTGTMSQESYKLFSGVTPETLALFGESLGLEESGIDAKSEVFQQYLKMAKTNRSAMKRLIQRKGIDGFSEDAGRVLAGFVYSNARQVSTNLHASEIGRAASSIQDGDVKDHAIRLMQYIQNPTEEAQALKGLLFNVFLGGNISSALVNLSQTATTTFPYLSQFDGAASVMKRLGDATKLVARGIRGDDELRAALKRAEDEGIVSPQEVFHLMAQAQGKAQLQTGDGTRLGDALAKTNNFMTRATLVWGRLFSAAEQANRRIAFIAAYKMARDKGMENPFAFAEKAVLETQFSTNKGIRPAWARGAVGGVLFTFKGFTVAYLELLGRMLGNGPEGKKAFGLALGTLFLFAGAAGLPFMDDLDDAIDAFAQRVLGKSFDSKQAKREFFASILGQTGADFVMGGISSLPGAPIDVSGRLGLGNIVPGTGILPKKDNYQRDAMEVFGPAGSLFTNYATAVGLLAQGEVKAAATTAAPLGFQNVIKGMDMAQVGYYRDMRGRKVIDTNGWEALAKSLGFQPASVKKIQDATVTQQGLISQNKLRETEIADKMAKARIERKPDLEKEAREELADWNRKNPESPIRIDASQINRRVQQAMMTKARRLEKTAPQEIRQSVKRELEGAER